MRGHATRWSSWLQLAIAISIVVAVAAAVHHELTAKPEDTLYIVLGDLRSRAAELQRVADDAAAERLTATFVETQSMQLAKAIDGIGDTLADVVAEASVPDAARAHALALRLLALSQSLAARAGSAAAAAPVRDEARTIVDALLPLERAARANQPRA